jgi:hypothetical protein
MQMVLCDVRLFCLKVSRRTCHAAVDRDWTSRFLADFSCHFPAVRSLLLTVML